MVKLPWELLTPFGDFLRGLPSKQGRNEEEDEEDEDEIQAYHDSMQRLKASLSWIVINGANGRTRMRLQRK